MSTGMSRGVVSKQKLNAHDQVNLEEVKETFRRVKLSQSGEKSLVHTNCAIKTVCSRLQAPIPVRLVPMRCEG